MLEFTPPAITDASDEVANDAIQLVTIANFNGLCRVIASLAHNGVLAPDQLENIHDCMTTPLDDPDWRDDEVVACTRDTLETVLAGAMKDSRRQWDSGPDLDLIPD